MITLKTNQHGIDVYSLTNQPKELSRTEWLEGVDFYQFAIKKYPELKRLLFHVANESQSKPQYRQKLSQQGLTSGVSDYLLLSPRGAFSFMTIELKRARIRDSKTSEAQLIFLAKTNMIGGYSCICNGYEAALFALEKYLNKNLYI